MGKGLGAARADQEAGAGALGEVDLAGVEHRPGAQERVGNFCCHRRDGVQGHRRTQGDLEHRQAAFDQGAGERHGVGCSIDREHGNDRSPSRNGGDVHCQTLQPPSITFTVPVVKDDSSLAR